jgi:UDP-glucose 4-epimerase
MQSHEAHATGIAELEHVRVRSLPVVHDPPRPGDVRDTRADKTRLRKLFPDVSRVPLTKGYVTR